MKVGLGLTFSIIFISFSSLYFSQTLADDNPCDFNYWCNTTPHPEPCKIFMGSHRRAAPKHQAEFRTMAVQVALERALHAVADGRKIGQRCRSKHQKAAWTDCQNLLDNTIFQLNQTIDGLKKKKKKNGIGCTDFDAQTWLSAALTNLQVCESGSVQLNVSKFIAPILSNNVSELISNSLAINAVLLYRTEEKDELGFPKWLPEGERKLLQSSSLASRANVVVAKDGSGNFRSIQAAINYAVARRKGSGRITVHVKRGIYRENIEISKDMNRITLVGDGLRYTIITGSRSSSSGFTTYGSATVGVDGVGFYARGITFRNTAGPQNGQAVALRSASDLSVFYACSFEGYQDTLFVHAQRQFFKTCYIFGTIDFIFGNAAVVFQNCMIYVRKPLLGQANTITAQGRGDPFQNTGISIQNSRVMATPELNPVVRSFKTFLGRPWQQYSRTVFMKTYLGSLVSAEGWSPWLNTNFAQDTVYYGEYRNFGPASSTRKRVNWKGYHVIRSATVASQFTVTNLIAGRTWLPATGVPFTAGL